MYYKTRGYRLFSLFNHVLLGLLALLCILPMLHLLAVSLSSAAKAGAGLVTFWPQEFTLYAYQKSVMNAQFASSLWVSVQRTVLGTAFSMFVMLLAAYSLSKDSRALKGRSVYLWYFVFTMLFNGGLIPNYILVSKLGLMDTLWALILPGAVSVYNVILLLNFFRTVPAELEESALMDGAGHFRTFWSIFLPISLPAIATISLFTMVGHWNAYFDGLIYIKDKVNYPLASYLQTIIVQQDFRTLGVEDFQNFSQRTLKAAQIFVGALPIMLVYPFLQRFFVKGMVLGAVKE
ncbi:carbohydrate ABC transporter permease [Paenibacillus sp. S-38]|uniref:carbohydrate ABC transporter permease n=1 Tax=Paenibacillus sp. S-38 TaxID=3416710 RepID=UPI003CFA8CEF